MSQTQRNISPPIAGAMQSTYEKGCDEVTDESGAIDICAHCASEDKLQPSLYYCFRCGLFGRYMCGDCNKQHRKYAHGHEVKSIFDAAQQKEQNIGSYERGCDASQDDSGATDSCAHCASDSNIQPAVYFCFHCGPFGRYMCENCNKYHKKFANAHEVRKLLKEALETRQEKQITPRLSERPVATEPTKTRSDIVQFSTKSGEAGERIRDSGRTNTAYDSQATTTSTTNKDGYILKWNKENVEVAHRKILQSLLEEKRNDETRRREREDVSRGTKEFAKMMYEEEPVVPSYWNMFRPDASLKDLRSIITNFGKKYKKISLPQESQPYSAIIKMINATFYPSKIRQGQDAAGLDQCRYSKLFVLEIERIENPELFEKFAGQKRAFFRRLFLAREGSYPEISKLRDCSGSVKTEGFVHPALDKDIHQELNEVFLFHGTMKENVKVICNSGFDHRYGSGKAMFGPGIYGAECSMKADQYTDDKTQRTSGPGNKKKMFLMRMLLGNAFLCSEPNPHKFRRPPCTHCLMDDCTNSRHAGKFGHLFDSIVGDNKKLFREFVVYDSTLCYPEYLITYERR